MSSVPKSRPSARRHDETRSPLGVPLPGWRRVIERVEAFPEPQRQARQREIDRLLRANGAAYNPVVGTSASDDDVRPWRLDLVPMVIESADWQQLSEGLLQRARLKQALLADIYGEQTLLSAGLVPPAMIYAHRGYLRDARYLPESGTLPLVSVDVSRSPSGDWYVVDDICQYPAGVGYALENRLVLSRVLPQLFRDCRVHRVAGYFRALQQRVVDAIDRDARCVLLGYDASHRHYFEFAWLAKYLGYTLVELGDLTVRSERVYLKTVAGLQRIDVILRFVDDTVADPLAVDNRSGRGVPGLLQAVRAGEVEIINPLGSGVLDNPALNACMKALCRHLLDEDLKLLGAPTYWLGDEEKREHVLSRFDDLLFRNIDSIGRLDDPRLMSGDARATLEREISLVPERFVAQERIDRSLAPGYDDDQRVSRQVTIRSFMVDDGHGYSVMGGGLCLLDSASGGRRPSFESLIGSKDVWVLSDAPVKYESLMQSRVDEVDYAVMEGELPSRVAENLFWLGRNAERSEMTLRVLRAVCRALQIDDAPTEDAEGVIVLPLDETPPLHALLRTATTVTGSWPGFVGKGGSRRRHRPDRELLSLLRDPARQGSVGYVLALLRRSAAAVGDRLSPEMMRVLNVIEDRASELSRQPTVKHLTDDPDALNTTVDGLGELVGALSAFAGLAHENFTHSDGWRFMMLGRRIERARQTAAVIRTMLERDRRDERVLEDILQLLDSIMTYRSRYRTRLDGRLVLQLVALDESNPRSLAFQFAEIDGIMKNLPGRRPAAMADPLARIAVAGLSRVRLADAGKLMHSGANNRQTLGKFLEVLEALPGELSTLLTNQYFTHTEARREVGIPGAEEPEAI